MKSKLKRYLTPENQRKKEEFEAIVKRRILAITPKAKLREAELSGPPKPSAFAKRDDFINAYVKYKIENIDESTKEQYRKKAGGLTSYKLDMKNEAAAIWRESQ